MRRRVVLLLLSLVGLALVGSVRGQNSNEKKGDAAQDTAKKEVLDAEEQRVRAVKSGDPAAIAPFYADDFLLTTERFGKGRVLTKAQFLQMYGSNKQHDVKDAHDNILARAYGNTVVLTGHSTTVLRYNGKASRGPRLFTFVWVKQGGRWEVVSGHISDIPKGYEAE